MTESSQNTRWSPIKRGLLLTGLNVVAFGAVILITLVLLYRQAVGDVQARLSDMVDAQAGLIAAVAHFDAGNEGLYPVRSRDATLAQMLDGLRRTGTFSDSGAIVLGEKQGDSLSIVYPAPDGNADASSFPFGGSLAIPMQEALKGNTGTVIATDYRGTAVLAAYTYIPELELGLVARYDLSTLRYHFLAVGYQAMAVGALVAFLVSVYFMAVISPLIRRRELAHQDAREANKLLNNEIVQHKTAMRNLVASQQRLELALASTGAGFWQWYVEENRLVLDDSFASSLGYGPEKFDSSSDAVFSLIHPDDQGWISQLAERLAEGHDTFDVHFRAKHRDGEYRWLRSHGLVIERDAEGGPVCIIGIQIDETSRVEREAELADEAAFHTVLSDLRSLRIDATREEVFRNLLNNCVSAYDMPCGCLVEADSDGLLRHLYAARNDGQMQPVAFNVATDITDQSDCLIREAINANHIRKVELANISCCASVRAIAAEADCNWALVMPLFTETKVALILFAHGDTAFGDSRIERFRHLIELAGSMLEYRARERAAHETNAQLALALESMEDAVYVTDTEPKILFVNRAFEKLTGYTQDEVIGKNPSMLSSGTHDVQFYEKLWATLLSGTPWHGVLVNRGKDGRITTEQSTIAPMLDAAGIIRYFVAVKHDITQELQIQQQLRQAQKLESIGTLAGGIAHDFNNILSVILGYTEIVQNSLEPKSTAHEELSRVREAGMRAKELVRQILTFSRMNEQASAPLAVVPVIKEALKMLRSTLPSSIMLNENVGVTYPMVIIDPTQMHQIIMNLCTNAAQALGESQGTIAVSLRETRISEAEIAAQGLAAADQYVEIRVEDSGPGISEDIRDRIFDPFFTTKRQGEGTGLGLATVHGIVRTAGGAIELVDSALGGAAFRILFPTTQEPEHGLISHLNEAEGGSESIVVVDDEEDIARIIARRLERRGYSVTSFSDSGAAFEAIGAGQCPCDLVLTDQQMPGMNGIELLKAIRKAGFSMPVVVMTGFSSVVTPETCTELGFDGYVNKPVETNDLLEVVRAALDRAQLRG
ncbi:MAG: PAS domain S-box protein [Candidatus Hydrogenedens sp.]|nr:PAS domain S-box protein [Candidatus Hydrogenedens sp.]